MVAINVLFLLSLLCFNVFILFIDRNRVANNAPLRILNDKKCEGVDEKSDPDRLDVLALVVPNDMSSICVTHMCLGMDVWEIMLENMLMKWVSMPVNMLVHQY